MGLRTENIEIPAGGKLERSWLLTLNGSPRDISGWTARMQIRSKKSSAVVLASFSTSSGEYMSIVGPAGMVMLDVPGAVTATYDFNSGVYDVYVFDQTGEPYRIVEGTALVSATVTR